MAMMKNITKCSRDQVTIEKEEILSPWKLSWRSFKRDRMGLVGAAMILMLILVSIFANHLAPYNPREMIYQDSLQNVSHTHLMGTDRFGRDQLSRVIAGTRTSMIVSFGSVAIVTVLGVFIGLTSGFYGGIVDNIIMRMLDIFYAFPTILLALAAVAALGPSMVNLIFVIGIIFGARFARVVRGSVLSVKEKDFIEGARSDGARDSRIMGQFIFPNVLGPMIVQTTFNLSTAIMIEAGLSFLGLGTQPPRPSWGQMLSESRPFMEFAPWLAVFPGLAIIFAVLAFNFFGDGLRDALDPRLARR